MKQLRNRRGKVTNYKVLSSILVASVALLTGCKEQQVEQEKQLRPVRTLEISLQHSGRVQEFTAVVDAAKKVDLAFKISGEIVQLAAAPGTAVKKGDLIAKLEDKDVRLQLQDAQAAFDMVKADYDRALNLISTQYISQSEIDSLKAKYNSAQAQLESAKNRLEYTELKAPFSGVIAKRFAESYQEVSALQPIASLHDLKNVHFKIDVPESLMIFAAASGEEPVAFATFDAIKNVRFPIQFQEVNTEADDVTRNYQVTFSMPSPSEHSILPGMSATVEVERAASGYTSVDYYLPSQSVLKDEKGMFVYLVTQTEQGVGKIERREVVVGELTALGFEVFSGVQAGEHVITAGMSKVSDGMLVKFNG